MNCIVWLADSVLAECRKFPRAVTASTAGNRKGRLVEALNAGSAEVGSESNVQSSPRCASPSAILRDLCVQNCASSVISVTSVVKPVIHLPSVWYSVDRPLGECPEIMESLEGITFQRAWSMSRIPLNAFVPSECVRV